MVTYDSGSDGLYLSEKDRRKAGLPILRPSTQTVGVTNGGTSKAKHNVTKLTFGKILCSNNADGHIPGLPYFFDECGQDG
jgi:hypothetical protein